jgi:hypothetical protein
MLHEQVLADWRSWTRDIKICGLKAFEVSLGYCVLTSGILDSETKILKSL